MVRIRLVAAFAFLVPLATRGPTQQPAQQAAQQPAPRPGTPQEPAQAPGSRSEPAAPQPSAVADEPTGPSPQDKPGPVANILLETCDWREIGPFRGGRVGAVTGVRGQRDTFWFGGTGGGVWKTTDGGKNWKNVSDGFFGGSIGAVAVAPSDASVVFAGGGEQTWRGNVSSGDGMWKSVDAGTSWEFVGLHDSRHISRICIHPKDKDLVYAAVMGHVSGPNEERGVFRTKDGGKTWERILFANDLAGAVDLCLDPKNANVIYASTWRAIRTPWSFESGGDGSALWKSTDGGTTWQELSRKTGMPKGTLGIIGVSVSGADSQRVYAMVEAEEGGMFRSDDAGETWTRVNEDRNLRQRAWYYTRCYADPKAKDTVYVVNVGFHRSTDGGKTFASIDTPHGDNHDLWIDPDDPARMVEGNDGGATVSTDGGKTWTTIDNQPTAQFYRVTTDRASPYRIYGAQQDNSTVRIRSRSRGPGIARSDWESTAGGESGWIAPKPGDPEIVFGGSYGGYLQRLDHRQGLSRSVAVWPDNPLGWGAAELKYRFQWNYPVLFSPHDGNVLYTAANVLFRSTNEGQTWVPISGDLTRNDKTKQQASGGPITKDNTAVEYYCTIFTVAESPRQKGVIWCGSDDGLVHVTRDGGASWANVTPKGMPEWMQINCIEASPHVDGGAYVAGTRYKLDDFRPYLWVTDDFGATWREATAGIDPGWFTRCIRADPVRKGLLFAGTERGVWMSFDDGWRWQRLMRGLPLVPVCDLGVEGSDLIAATQGRSFWVFSHLEHLRQLVPALGTVPLHLFAPNTLVLGGGSGADPGPGLGRNPASSIEVRALLGGGDAPVPEGSKLTIRDFDGKVVHERDAAATDEKKKFTLKRGMNVIACDLVFEAPKKIEGLILWSGQGSPPKPAPGEYSVTLKVGEQELTAKFRIAKDPRSPASDAELQAKHRFVVACCDALTRAHTAIEQVRSLRTQMDAVAGRMDGDVKKELEAQAKTVKDALTAIEEALYQTKSKSSQDPLNYPIRLNDKLAAVLGAVNGAEFGPTDGQVAVQKELIAAIDAEVARLEAARKDGVAAFNALALKLQVPHVK